jgi:hypothetical protein
MKDIARLSLFRKENVAAKLILVADANSCSEYGHPGAGRLDPQVEGEASPKSKLKP